jgi:hypothetical protein
MRRESYEEVTQDFPDTRANTEIEDKSRLSDELAVQILRQLDTGLEIEVPGWGCYPVRPLGVSRIIDRYYDTPDRMFQTWSKVHGKQLLLRDRQEGRVVGDVDPGSIQSRADIIRLPVEDETHIWVVKVPLRRGRANSRIRKAREHEVPYTDREGEAVKAELMSIIRQVPGLKLDPTTVDVQECVLKVRKSYGVFSQRALRGPERSVATISLDFIVREYYQPHGVSIERYIKYEVEKQGRTTARQFAACRQTLRAVFHISEAEPAPVILRF